MRSCTSAVDDADGEPDAAAAGDTQPSNKEVSPTLSGSDEATVIGTQSNVLRDAEARELQVRRIFPVDAACCQRSGRPTGTLSPP